MQDRHTAAGTHTFVVTHKFVTPLTAFEACFDTPELTWMLTARLQQSVMSPTHRDPHTYLMPALKCTQLSMSLIPEGLSICANVFSGTPVVPRPLPWTAARWGSSSPPDYQEKTIRDRFAKTHLFYQSSCPGLLHARAPVVLRVHGEGKGCV